MKQCLTIEQRRRRHVETTKQKDHQAKLHHHQAANHQLKHQ